jgi:two-component system cell cycle response regulator
MTARILVVDHMAAHARLLEARLIAEYYEVTGARDGYGALETAHRWQPDLILLDVAMRGPDGFEICRRLKEDEATLHIPVVMLTSRVDTAERLRGLESGADDVLTRPVDDTALLARVRSLVRLKRMLDEWRARGETARGLGLTGDSGTELLVSGAHALVIDDQAASMQLIRDALGQDGVLAEWALNETDALTLCAVSSFDLIIISLSLTGDDPLRLAARLRAADTTHDVPMLLIAAPGQVDRVLRGFELGANDWLVGPVDGPELRARARNQIRRKFYQDRLRADLGHALEMALTDPLTGLYNQRYLVRHLRGLLSSRPSGSLALLMIDVDHFKAVNDRYGHGSGDRALKLTAEALRARTRVFDSVARYGGEEFVVLMPGSSAEEALAAGERLRAAIEAVVFSPLPGTFHRLTVSIGVAVSCKPDQAGGVDGAELLMQEADAALYEAKRNGRNRVELAAPRVFAGQ